MKPYAAFKKRKRTKAAAHAYSLRLFPPTPIDDPEAGPSMDPRINVDDDWYGTQGNSGHYDNDNERQKILVNLVLTDKITITGQLSDTGLDATINSSYHQLKEFCKTYAFSQMSDRQVSRFIGKTSDGLLIELSEKDFYETICRYRITDVVVDWRRKRNKLRDGFEVIKLIFVLLGGIITISALLDIAVKWTNVLIAPKLIANPSLGTQKTS